MDAIILTKEYKGKKPGTIKFLNDTDFQHKDLKKIPCYDMLTLQQANYLNDFSPQKSLAKHKRNKFGCLTLLGINDSCFWKPSNEIVTIIEKNITDNSLIFKIRSKSGIHSVKASEIKPDKSMTNTIQEVSQNIKIKCNSMRHRVSGIYSSMVSKSPPLMPIPRKERNSNSISYPTSWKYVGIDTDFSEFSFVDKYNEFEVDSLVEIDDENELFGRIAFFIENQDEYFAGITLNADMSSKMHKCEIGFEKVLFKDVFMSRPFEGCIVPSDCIKVFDYPLKVSRSPPFLLKDSFRFVEMLPFDPSTDTCVIKLKFSIMDTVYGKIQQKRLINNEPCLDICLLVDGNEIDERKFLKESDSITVEKFEDEIKFYDGVVIYPQNIITLEIRPVELYKEYDEVCFRLRKSGKGFCGTLVCTVILNGLASAVVELDRKYLDENMIKYKCRPQLLKIFNCKNNIINAFLVPLSMLHKDKSKELFQIMKYMFENYDNWTDGIIDEVMAKRDESILSFVIGHIQQDIDIDRSPDLLTTLFDRGDLETLKVLLTKSKLGEKSNLTLLEMAFKCLSNDTLKSELFDVLIDKCSDRNIQLSNKETFLTNLFKTAMPEELIIEIIESNKFDVTVYNDVGETPLRLACEVLLINTIKVLLDTSKIKSSDVRNSKDYIFKEDKFEEDCKLNFQVVKLLDSYSEKCEKSGNICNICSKNLINTAFDCGHLFCDKCTKKFKVCPNCKKPPKETFKIYL